jgi:hypothetical protein
MKIKRKQVTITPYEEFLNMPDSSIAVEVYELVVLVNFS